MRSRPRPSSPRLPRPRALGSARAWVAGVALLGAFGSFANVHTARADGPAAAATPRAVSAIVTVADGVRVGLGATPPGALVVVAPPKSDAPLTRGDDLSVRIAQIVAGKVGARAHEKAVQLGTARALAGRASSLVFVQPEIEKGELRLVADVYTVVKNSWERLKNPAPGPSAHAFASAPIDAEVRAFMPPLALEQGKVSRAKHGEGEIVALACGDVDGDGSLEIAFVSQARVALGRVVAGATAAAPPVVRVDRFVASRELGPRLAVPSREPLGGAVIVRGATHGALLVGTSERGGVSLGPDLVVRHVLSGVPVSGSMSCASLVPEQGAFDGLKACFLARDSQGASDVHEKVLDMPLPPRFDAISELRYVDTKGEGHRAVAIREPSAKLRVRVDGNEVLTMDGVGAQVLLADLDLDGIPEIVTTAAEGDDRLVITSLEKAPRVRLRTEAKEGVRALAVCPPEAGGKPVLVAAVGQEVWLVR